MSAETFCIECGRPWGVIFERTEEPTDERVAEARAALIESLREQWECDYEPDQMDALDETALPQTELKRIVYISEALARFADERGIGEAYLDGCWQTLDDVDLPAWLLKGRKQRWAVLWDCCNIGSPEFYAKAVA